MKTKRVVGQPPKLRSIYSGKFIRIANTGDVVTSDTFVTIGAGGGFDSTESVREFRVIGSVVHRVRVGDATSYAVTEVDVPD